MKKIFYLMSVCALAFISCQKEEMEGLPQAGGKFVYEFVASHLPEAKATIGEKVDDQWPVLWSKGDQMGVYKADGTFVGIATVSDESEGQNSGKFSVKSDVELTAGDNLYFSYPYVANAEIKTGKVTAEQTLGASGVGANAIAYATVQYNPGNTEFVLTHANAYLKFNIKSEEFAGYNLTGVTLWADGAELAGSVEIADGGALTVSGAEDYVKSSLATSVRVGAEAQPVYVAALPADLSQKTVYAIVHMKGVAGTETATHTVELPVKLNGAGSLVRGSMTEIDLPALSKSLAPAWYEPVETRYVAAYGKGWSYGKENTVLFTRYQEAYPVDLKARGNFMKVKEPKYVQLYYMSGSGTPTADGAKILINDIQVATKDDTSFPTEVEVTGATVNVLLNNLIWSKGQMAAMLVKDADKNVIWGINLWLAWVKMETSQYDNGTVMSRNLGTDEVFSTSGSARAAGSFFQWGRPFAFPNYNTDAKSYLKVEQNTAVTSLDVSAANPYIMYYPSSSDKTYNKDWYYGTGTFTPENDLRDLWGNPDPANGSRGNKSIYDPCPKGYMVVSPAILKEVMENAKEVEQGSSYKYIAYKGGEWGYAGGYNCDGWTVNSGNFKVIDNSLRYWSNSNYNNGEYEYAYCMFSEAYNTDGTVRYVNNFRRAGAFPVRCMVDTENR